MFGLFLGFSPGGLCFLPLYLRTVFGDISFTVVSPALLLRQVGRARSTLRYDSGANAMLEK